MELVTVIGIILIMAGLFVGAAGPVQTLVMTSKCQQNLRQVGTAVSLYCGENNHLLPPYASWQSSLASYLSISTFDKAQAPHNLFICPAAWKLHGNSPGLQATQLSSYGMNNGLNPTAGVYSSNDAARGIPVSRISSPVSKIHIADGRFAPAGWGWARDISSPNATDGMVHPESRAGNYLFFDGHVETLTATQATNAILWDLRQ